MLNDDVMLNHKFLRELLGYIEENILVADMLEKHDNRVGELADVIDFFVSTEIKLRITYGSLTIHHVLIPFRHGLKIETIKEACIKAVDLFQEDVYVLVDDFIKSITPRDADIRKLSFIFELPEYCKIRSYQYGSHGRFVCTRSGSFSPKLPDIYRYYDLIVGGQTKSRINCMLNMVRQLREFCVAIDKAQWLQTECDNVRSTVDVEYTFEHNIPEKRTDGSTCRMLYTYPLITGMSVMDVTRDMLVRNVALAYLLSDYSERELCDVTFKIKTNKGYSVIDSIYRRKIIDNLRTSHRLDKRAELMPSEIKNRYIRKFGPQDDG